MHAATLTDSPSTGETFQIMLDELHLTCALVAQSAARLTTTAQRSTLHVHVQKTDWLGLPSCLARAVRLLCTERVELQVLYLLRQSRRHLGAISATPWRPLGIMSASYSAYGVSSHGYSAAPSSKQCTKVAKPILSAELASKRLCQSISEADGSLKLVVGQ